MKVSLSGYDVAFPLLTGKLSGPGLFDTNKEILGTAFPIGGGYLITAGHVADALQCSGCLSLLALPAPGAPDLTSASVVQDIERLPHDIAILQARQVPDTGGIEPVIPWFTGEVSAFDDLWAIGYPYGMITAGELQRIQLRTFRGHTVANPSHYELPTDSGRPTAVYELSFHAPRGLSGAPLVAGLPGEPRIAGIVVGNSSQSMIVHTERERDASGGEVTIVERHESMHLGIAIQAAQALSLNSRLLGSSVGGHLAKRDALRDAL